MEHFTPVSGAVGGALIGAAATLLMLFNGRIAGISGIAGGVLERREGDTAWRWAFIAGLILGPFAVWGFTGAAPAVTPQAGWAGLMIAGLLVGFGARLGSGCTSGHGICGISRLSGRSLVATAVFMTAAVATVFVLRHLAGG